MIKMTLTKQVTKTKCRLWSHWACTSKSTSVTPGKKREKASPLIIIVAKMTLG